MKRTYKYALSVVLGLGMAVPAFAQDGFPDVKDTHWAADSVNKLKLEGLIHGDSDGNFNGTRTMTRYEVASIVYAVYAKLVGFNSDVEKNLKALEAKINSVGDGGSGKTVDLSDIKTGLADLQKQVGGMKEWSSDLAQLKKMASAYSNELKSLGVDVESMKKNISDLAARVSKLEQAGGGIQITGDANFFMAMASQATGSTAVVNQDGQYLQSFGTGGGFDNLITMHEFGVKITDPSSKIPYKAEVVATNMLNSSTGTGFGVQSYNPTGAGSVISSSGTSVYLHELTATLPQWNLSVGRQGLKLGNYILSRPDTTSFYKNSRWDDHTWRMDGGVLAFGQGGKLFWGTLNNTTTTGGFNVQPMQLTTLGVQRVMGGSYDFKFAEDKGGVTASYVDFDGSLGVNVNFLQDGKAQPQGIVQQSGITRYNVYGADLHFNAGSFMLEGGAGKSVAYGIAANNNDLTSSGSGSDTQNLDTLVDTANGRWNVALSTHSDSYGLKLGYRNVETNYVAPGDWGRVSVFRNLTNTKALSAYGMAKLSDKLHIHGSYEKGDAITGTGDYKMWKAGFGYELTQKWGMMASYEDTKFKSGFQGIADGAESKFTTVNLGYDMGEHTMFNLFWQNGDLNNIITTVNGIGNAQKGSFYGAQFSVKF
ncbi:MAG: S-layer homology domain-containing protein [Armatimonadetes bacterium]|nr:S-layer homology domain-containing protein [Armatimonadota bacterium]